jgi:phosphate transport system substrate-binding protein
MMLRTALLLCAVLGVISSALRAEEGRKIDPALQKYQKVEGISGSLKGVGSDTMNNLMSLWAEGFKKHYPGVQIEIEGKGSSTAPPALIAGAADFGSMSREMKSAEIDEFEKKFGYKPTGMATSIDMLAVFVHKDNPLSEITLPQVDAIFSKTRNGGYDKDILNWGDLGLKGEWESLPISCFGRNAASGTYGTFKEMALKKGDFRPSVQEQPGSQAVVTSVGKGKGGIGYSGIGVVTADVKPLALAKAEGTKPIPPTPEFAYTGTYPLSRFLFLYVNIKPGTPLDPLKREFLKYVYSADGQEEVAKDGFYPITAKLAEKALSAASIK